MFEMLPQGAFEPRPGGGMRLHGKGGSDAPPPDPRLIEAQIRSLGIQDDAIRRVISMSESMQPLIKEQMSFGLQSARTAFDQSQVDRTYALERRDHLTDMQNRQLEDARDFDSKSRSDQLSKQAIADVEMQASANRKAMERAQDRANIDPSSGKAMAMAAQSNLSEVVAKAGAGNVARERARAEGRALVDRSANSLAGFPTMGMQTTGAGAAYGAAGLGLVGQGLSTLNAGNTTAISGGASMGSNATSMYGAQASYKNAQDQIAASSDPFNTILGAAAGIGTSWAMGKFL
jgi:hypothetical protein